MSPQFDVIFHVTHFVIFADVNKNIFETPSSFLVQFIEKNIFRDQTHLNTQIEGIYLLVQWCRKVWKLCMPPKEDFHKLVGAVITDWSKRNFRVIGLKVIQDWPGLQIDLKFAFNYKYFLKSRAPTRVTFIELTDPHLSQQQARLQSKCATYRWHS